MTARRCIPWPAAVLRTPAGDVAAITDEIRAVWRDMVDTMEAMPGYGLAAVQIGVPLRLAVVDCSEARGQAVLMANPKCCMPACSCARMRRRARTCPACRP